MKPARWFVLLILTVGGIGAFVNGAVLYTRLLYVGVLIVVLAWLMTALSLHGVRVERRARALRAAVGDVFEEHYELINESWAPKLWLEVSNESNIPDATGSRIQTLIPARQKRSYTTRTWLNQRGSFPLGPTAISSGDPFGLFRRSKKIPATASVVVMPLLVSVTEFISPPGLLPGGRAIRRKSIDITPHAAGVREYVPGDAVKRIHWPTSIRRNQLMVKEFEQDPQAEVWIFLDAYRLAHYAKPGAVKPEPPEDDLFLLRRRQIQLEPATFEYAATIAASLAHYFMNGRRSVGLVAASERAYTVIPAERSERQEEKILEALAFLQPESTVTLPTLVTAQMGQLPKGSSAILITATTSNELLIAVDSLQRRSLRPVVVLMMSTSFGVRTSNEPIARSLEERNVPVCRVFCDADLSTTLSSFYSKTNAQEITWRRPILSHLT